MLGKTLEYLKAECEAKVMDATPDWQYQMHRTMREWFGWRGDLAKIRQKLTSRHLSSPRGSPLQPIVNPCNNHLLCSRRSLLELVRTRTTNITSNWLFDRIDSAGANFNISFITTSPSYCPFTHGHPNWPRNKQLLLWLSPLPTSGLVTIHRRKQQSQNAERSSKTQHWTMHLSLNLCFTWTYNLR